MSWEDYANMTKRQRTSLTRKAARGDKVALDLVRSYTNEMKVLVNRRLRDLKRHGMDYGPAFNHLMSFTATEYKSTRLMSFNELKGDVYDAQLQNDHAFRFLQAEYTTVEGARKAERYRIGKLQELMALPENFSYRRSKRFLRFLGSEEVSASIDQYGTSDVMVKMMWDAYNNNGTKKKQFASIMGKALAEYLDDKITFDEAFERVGIKIEDYYTGRPSS